MDVKLCSAPKGAPTKAAFTDERRRVVPISRRWDQAVRDVAHGEGDYEARYTWESTL